MKHLITFILFTLLLTLNTSSRARNGDELETAEAFIRTVLSDDPDAISQAIKAGADVNQITGTGQPVLCAASMLGKLKAVRTLLEKGAELQDACIVAAVANNQVYVLAFLLDKSKNPDLVASDNGDRLLHMAVRALYPDTVELLLKLGANRELTNHDGDTAQDLLQDQSAVISRISSLLSSPSPKSPNH